MKSWTHPHVPYLRTLTDTEKAAWNPQRDEEAVEAAKVALLHSIDQLRAFVENDFAVLADTEIVNLTPKLQRWNAARSGFAGAFEKE